MLPPEPVTHSDANFTDVWMADLGNSSVNSSVNSSKLNQTGNVTSKMEPILPTFHEISQRKDTAETKMSVGKFVLTYIQMTVKEES